MIGVAGVADKCARLENDLCVENTINCESRTPHESFKTAVGCLDVYFDNVGGELVDLALTKLNRYARVVLCGRMSTTTRTYPDMQMPEVMSACL